MAENFRTEAANTVERFIRDREAKLKVLSSSQRIFLCGDFDTHTIEILKEVENKLIADGYNPFILVPDDSKLDHFNKEIIALEHADVISIIDGKKAGTWTETVLSILNDDFGRKSILFFDSNVKGIDDVGSCQDYHLYFPSKYGYKNKEDLIKQIVTFSKQRVHHNAAIIIKKGVLVSK